VKKSAANLSKREPGWLQKSVKISQVVRKKESSQVVEARENNKKITNLFSRANILLISYSRLKKSLENSKVLLAQELSNWVEFKRIIKSLILALLAKQNEILFKDSDI
jgi:hypothetical protein